MNVPLPPQDTVQSCIQSGVLNIDGDDCDASGVNSVDLPVPTPVKKGKGKKK